MNSAPSSPSCSSSSTDITSDSSEDESEDGRRGTPQGGQTRGARPKPSAASICRSGGGSGGGEDSESLLTSVDNLKSMQEILPGLWCGSYVPAMEREFLKAHHITHICCCVDVGRFPFPEDFMYMKLPLMDANDADAAQFFPRTFEFIENALIKQRGAVLVHCGAGISRAPTITAAYLIRKLRLSATAAIALVQQRRPFASPNKGFRSQLRAYAEKMSIKEAQLLQGTSQSAIKAVTAASNLKDGSLQRSPNDGGGEAK